MRFTLSVEAGSDLGNIWDYTNDNWGELQADRYIDQLHERFLWLAENPKLGMERSEIAQNYRSYIEGKHCIFYREMEEGIEIIAIPHQREDVIQHLSFDHSIEQQPEQEITY